MAWFVLIFGGHVENRARRRFVHRRGDPACDFSAIRVGPDERLRAGENVVGQLSGRPGQDGFGLGAEASQLLGVGVLEPMLLLAPADGALECLSGLDRMTQPVVGHGQEEQVIGVELPMTAGQAALEGGDGCRRAHSLFRPVSLI
jgi:hypothetical protein